MKEKLLVLTVAYPEESSTYQSLVCVAGLTEDGDWRRIYPIPFKRYLNLRRGGKGIQKRAWIEYELREELLRGERKDYRKESKKAVFQTIRRTEDKLMPLEELMDILRPQVTSIERLRERFAEDRPSLGIVKPELIKLKFIPNKAYTGHRQSNLDSKIIQVTQLKDKPQYNFRCFQNDSCKPHNMICEDMEVGQLYRKYEQEEDIVRHEKMKGRLFHWMSKRDLHFVVGTHAFYPKSWLIIGLLYPKLPDKFQQLPLAS